MNLPRGVVLRPIPGLPGYWAGADGSIWSRRAIGSGAGKVKVPWHRLKPIRQAGGYLAVTVRPTSSPKVRTMKVHRLVLMAFDGAPPPGHEACHGDGDPAHNDIGNLRWDTRKANSADRWRHERARVDAALAKEREAWWAAKREREQAQAR
jgi:hypothetical protein